MSTDGQQLDSHSDATLTIPLQGDWQQFCCLLIALQSYLLTQLADPDEWPGDELTLDVQRMRCRMFIDQLHAAGIDSPLDEACDQL